MAKRTFPGKINEDDGAFMLERFTALLKANSEPYNKVKGCLEFRGADNCETTWKHFRCASYTIIVAIAKQTLSAIGR